MGILGNYNPFNGSLFKSITSNLQDMYNDYTGVTASQLSANAAAKNTAKQIAWERERAKNAHQWEMEDLKKAGLNPILSAGGSGAATGSITPQMPDFSKYKGAGGALMELGQQAFNNAITAQQAKNETNRVINETRETNSNLSIKRQQIELMQDELLNNAVKRGLIKEQTATEVKNRTKLQSDIELAKSQEFLNEQLRGKAEYEMNKLEEEIKLLKQEQELHPGRKEAQRIANELDEKENQVYYLKETISELTKIGGMGLSIYGTYKAGQAISAYKAEKAADRNKVQFIDLYNGKGKHIGQRTTYYKY